MDILLQIIYTVIVLGVLILIHELGHFITAKLSGVKVNEFAIGMGPTLFRIKGKETTYAIRLLPIGGFVAMEGEEEDSEDDRAFNKKSVWKRMLIVVAGAAMNLILGFVITTALVIMSTVSASTTVLGFEPDALSSQSGLNPGDRIVEVNGVSVNNYGDISRVFSRSEGSGALDIKVVRKGEEITLENVSFPTEEKNGKNYPKIDFKVSSGLPSTIVGGFVDGALSEQSGLQIGDRILKINGKNISIYTDIATAFSVAYNKDTLDITVDRNGETVVLEGVRFPVFQAAEDLSSPDIDFKVKAEDNTVLNVLKHSVFRTGSFVTLMYDTIIDMVTGKLSVKYVSGPVGTSTVIYQAAKTGIETLLSLVALISINLAVVNLLPLPALDGGKLVFLLIELIFRKKVPQKIEAAISFAGIVILMILMVVIVFKDIFFPIV
ncbi:MAG: RIP metalloprotease RseP [Clostridia bacterium]|nr:RIP metalloprotease RseP [Clostridia bacterium]